MAKKRAEIEDAKIVREAERQQKEFER